MLGLKKLLIVVSVFAWWRCRKSDGGSGCVLRWRGLGGRSLFLVVELPVFHCCLIDWLVCCLYFIPSYGFKPMTPFPRRTVCIFAFKDSRMWTHAPLPLKSPRRISLWQRRYSHFFLISTYQRILSCYAVNRASRKMSRRYDSFFFCHHAGHDCQVLP